MYVSMSEKSQVKSTESNDQLMEECASRDSEGLEMVARSARFAQRGGRGRDRVRVRTLNRDRGHANDGTIGIQVKRGGQWRMRE